MDDAAIDAKLAALGLELPPPPRAVAAYVPVVVRRPLAFVAGQIALVDGAVLHAGIVGDTVTVEEAADAARRCALQLLSALRAELGSLEPVERFLKLDVFVACGPSFTNHPLVANGASELLVELLGDPGRHARAAVGVPSLPLGASVEVAATVALAG